MGFVLLQEEVKKTYHFNYDQLTQSSFFICDSQAPLHAWIKAVCRKAAGPYEQHQRTDLLRLCLRLLPDGVEVFEQIRPHLLLMT